MNLRRRRRPFFSARALFCLRTRLFAQNPPAHLRFNLGSRNVVCDKQHKIYVRRFRPLRNVEMQYAHTRTSQYSQERQTATMSFAHASQKALGIFVAFDDGVLRFLFFLSSLLFSSSSSQSFNTSQSSEGDEDLLFLSLPLPLFLLLFSLNLPLAALSALRERSFHRNETI